MTEKQIDLFAVRGRKISEIRGRRADLRSRALFHCDSPAPSPDRAQAWGRDNTTETSSLSVCGSVKVTISPDSVVGDLFASRPNCETRRGDEWARRGHRYNEPALRRLAGTHDTSPFDPCGREIAWMEGAHSRGLSSGIFIALKESTCLRNRAKCAGCNPCRPARHACRRSSRSRPASDRRHAPRIPDPPILGT